MCKWFLMDEVILWFVLRNFDSVMLRFVVVVLLLCHHWFMMHILERYFMRNGHIVVNVAMDIVVHDRVEIMMNNGIYIAPQHWVNIGVMLFLVFTHLMLLFQVLLKGMFFVLNSLTLDFVRLLHFKLRDAFLRLFQFPLELMLSFQLLMFHFVPLLHGMISVLLGSLKLVVFEVVISTYAVLFFFQVMFDFFFMGMIGHVSVMLWNFDDFMRFANFSNRSEMVELLLPFLMKWLDLMLLSLYIEMIFIPVSVDRLRMMSLHSCVMRLEVMRFRHCEVLFNYMLNLVVEGLSFVV